MKNAQDKLGAAAALLALMAMGVAPAAIAGPRYSPPGVSIFINETGGGFASGTLGGTRNTADNAQRIGCGLTRTQVTSASGAVTLTTLLSCSARDIDRRSVACSSSDEALANVLTGVSNDALIEFFFDANGQCTNLVVYESTSLQRKH